MQRENIAPQLITGRFGYNAAVRISAPSEFLFVSGHEGRGSVDTHGGVGDFRAQVATTFVNIDRTLEVAGFSFRDVVQIRIFVRDIAAATSNYDVVLDALETYQCSPASLMAETTGLSDPAMLVEIEAVAVR